MVTWNPVCIDQYLLNRRSWNFPDISEEEYKRYQELFRQKRENADPPQKDIENYCAIFGSLPGKNVAAKSDLAVEVH